MATLNGAAQINGTQGAGATATVATFVPPDNSHIFLAVANSKASAPTTLALPVGPGATTWALVDTVVEGTRRLTLFEGTPPIGASGTIALASSDASSQTQWIWTTTFVLGGSGASWWVQKKTNHAASGTSLTVTSDNPFASPKNGAFACFFTSSATLVTPQAGWTEPAESRNGGASEAVETQFTGYSATSAIATGGSGAWIGIAVELQANTISIDAFGIVAMSASGGTAWGGPTNPRATILVNGHAGRPLFLWFAVKDNTGAAGLETDHSVLSSGLTWREIYNKAFSSVATPGNRVTLHVATPSYDGTFQVFVTPIGGTNTDSDDKRYDYLVIEAVNVDTSSVLDGIVQQANVTNDTTGTPLTAAITPVNEANGQLMFTAGNSGATTGVFEIGWTALINTAVNGGAGNNVRALWRPSSDHSPSTGLLNANNATMCVLEMAPAAAVQHRPVVTIISPLPVGSRIATTTPIVFTVTDVDAGVGVGGGLERAVPIIQYPDGTDALVHDGYTFRPQFAGSSRTPVTNGYQYTVLPAGGRWHKAPTLLPWAWDMTGLEAL